MKKSQFLLLDAGPIIKLFELGLWEKFIAVYGVTITRTVIEEVVHTDRCSCLDYIDFPFEKAAEQGRIKIIDMAPSTIRSFLQQSTLETRYAIDAGEAETLTFLANSSEDFTLCAADGAVFSALGFLSKAEKGVSLEELLQQTGFKPSSQLEWRFTKRFREKYTKLGQVDSIRGQGFAT
jgi:hypothetical protein